MTVRRFSPPALTPPPVGSDLYAQFKWLRHYWENQYFPYVFDYFNTVNALDQIQFDAKMYPDPDGTTTVFTVQQGKIRLISDGGNALPNGTTTPMHTSPQAMLIWRRAPLVYTDSLTPLGGEFTVITPLAQDQPQTVVVGTPPETGDLFVLIAVLA